jgi:hypothetical protein
MIRQVAFLEPVVRYSNMTSRRVENVIEDLSNSYEERLRNIESIADAIHKILEDVQESFIDEREEQEKIKAEIRIGLAANKSFRKKDFDTMFDGIMGARSERGSEVKNLLRRYLDEQKVLGQVIRKKLDEFKVSLANGEIDRVKEFRKLLGDVLALQEKRREEITRQLSDFRKEQRETAARFKALLAKGSELRTQDVKATVDECREQQKKRILQNETRRKGVSSMLARAKPERMWRGFRNVVNETK